MCPSNPKQNETWNLNGVKNFEKKAWKKKNKLHQLLVQMTKTIKKSIIVNKLFLFVSCDVFRYDITKNFEKLINFSLLSKLQMKRTHRNNKVFSVQYHFVNSTQTSIAILSSFSIRLYPILNISLTFSLSLYTFPHMCSWISYLFNVSVSVSVFSHFRSSNTTNHFNVVWEERESCHF
jgi:hypothetical protein